MTGRTTPRPSAPPDGSDADLVAPGLVHELRQPLTGLGAALELVGRELGPTVTGLDAWKLAASQQRRLEETLDTYVRLMTPGDRAAAPFAAAAVIRQAIAELRHRIDASRVRFASVIDADVPRAHGVPAALHHAVTNLLANALDAVEAVGGEGRVEVRVARAEDGHAQVRVADEGVGILPAARRRLFAPRFTTKRSGSGLGLAVSRRMIRAAGGELRLAAEGDPATPPWARAELVIDLAAGPDAPAIRAAEPRRRDGWRGPLASAAVLAALALAVAASWAGFERWMRAGDAVPAAIARPAPSRPRVAVESLTGTLERRVGDGWLPVAAGAPLQEDDTLRTAEGSRATLSIGERSRVTVSDATQLTVREITDAAQRLRLSRGRLSVDHQPDGARVLVVEAEGGDAVARAGAARFSVLASGASLAIATETGVVRLQAGGRTVDVGPGEGSVAFPGEAPAPAAAIPVALLLELGRASTADGGCRIEGASAPGAEVRVDGRVVTAGADGRFTVVLRGPRGKKSATVLTRDAAGRRVERRVACAAPVDERVSDFAVRWGHE
jgi:two-component sensor histidine kinase